MEGSNQIYYFIIFVYIVCNLVAFINQLTNDSDDVRIQSRRGFVGRRAGPQFKRKIKKDLFQNASTKRAKRRIETFTPQEKQVEMVKKTDASAVQRAIRLVKLKTEFATWSKEQQKAEIESFKTRIIHER